MSELFDHYQFVREEIKNEHQLINNRLNITIAVQGFLFAGYVEVVQIDSTQTISHLTNVIIIILFGILVFPQLGIYGALQRISMWRKKQMKILSEIDDEDVKQEKQPFAHFFGLLAYRYTIPFVVLSWSYLFNYGNITIVVGIIIILQIIFDLINLLWGLLFRR
ncbi:MAG: hypothetical protein ACFB2X_00815 [Rivularia sp. (in: cyanobacteria)]